PAKPNELYFGARLNGLWKTRGELVTGAGTDLGAGQDSGSGSDLQQMGESLKQRTEEEQRPSH
ncbi:MAG: hypothetical protein JWP08_1844, partial [Bryobacterales bacterium]|nr:hypothetical protein [Bryobacterales bacterium]